MNPAGSGARTLAALPGATPASTSWPAGMAVRASRTSPVPPPCPRVIPPTVQTPVMPGVSGTRARHGQAAVVMI